MAKHPETPSAATLLLEPEGWTPHRAGQHVDVRLTAEDGYQAQRSYSIASAPEDHGLALTVERLDGGEVSGYLVDDMAPGDELELRGPIGGWFAWDVTEGGPLLLVAGGSGLVPLMAMLRHRQRQGSRIPTRLLVSVRTVDDLLYAEELRELAAAGDGFQLFVTVTRGSLPAPAGPGTALSGRVNARMLAEVAWAPPEVGRAYVCGSSPFVEVATSLLVELGYAPEKVRAERFGATGPVEVT